MNANALDQAQASFDAMIPMDEPAGIELDDEALYELMAQIWVVGGGDVRGFRSSVAEISAAILEGESDNGLIEDMAAAWVENGGDASGFVRCSGEICGWVIAEMSARGRF